MGRFFKCYEVLVAPEARLLLSLLLAVVKVGGPLAVFGSFVKHVAASLRSWSWLAKSRTKLRLSILPK